MFEFLSRSLTVVLENTDVLEAAVALQILKPQCSQTKELFNFEVARIPQVAVVAWTLEQNFVSANRPHAVVEAVATAGWLAFNVVQRIRMHDRARRPRAAIHAGQVGDDLRRFGVRTAKLAGLGARSGLDDIVTGDHPGTGDGIFTEFHLVRRTKWKEGVKWGIL